MTRWIVSLSVSIVLFLMLSGCDKDTTGSSPTTGTLRIFLTDAPGGFDMVNITFSQISAHIDSGWVTVTGQPQTINLLEWNNGNSIVLGEAQMPAGHYTQIRLIIDSANVVKAGQSHGLKIPSGAQTGLKFGPEFTINAGSTYELVIDFDVNRSIVVTGPSHNPTGYKLKPHIRVVPRAVTGSISGTVTNPDDLPTAYALQAGDTVTSTTVDTTNGFFMLSFLPSDLYTVAVADTAGKSFSQDSVMVMAGSDTNIGQITLH